MQFQDLHLSDTQLYALFRQYYTQGNYQGALNVLSQNPQLDLKAIIADNLNDLSERIHGLENVYYVEVEDYLTTLLNDTQAKINNLSNQNQFDATKEYEVMNFVYYNDEVYFCIQKPPVGTLPTDTTYWLHLGLFGEKGIGGMSNLVFVGEWDSLNEYNANEVVFLDNTFYWALQNTQGQAPDPSGSTAYWGIMFSVPIQKVVVASFDPSTQLATNDFWWQIV